MKSKLRLATIIFSSIFLTLSLLAGFFPQEWNYGFNHLRYFSTLVKFVFFLAGVSVLFPRINMFIEKIIVYISKIFLNKRKHLVYFTVSLLFFVLFWNFKSVIVYGDGGDIIRNFHTDSIIMTSPLTYVVIHATYSFSKSFLSVFEAIALSSAVAGMIFVYLTLIFSELLFVDRVKRTIFFFFIVSMGSMQLFFGHVEYTSWVATGILAYILTSYLFLKEKVSVIVPSIVLAVSILFHMSAGFLLPSLLYLVMQKKEQAIQRFLKALAAGVIVIVIMLSYVYFFEWNGELPSSDVDRFGRFGYGGVMAKFYPLFEIQYPEEQPATMFSLYHLNQIFNEHMLISPTGLFLLIFFIVNRNSIKVAGEKSFVYFLGVLLAFHLLYTSTGVMAFSGRQDWDVFSSVSIPITIIGSFLLLRNHSKREFMFVAVVLITLSLLHIIPWIAANHLGLPIPPTSAIMSNV